MKNALITALATPFKHGRVDLKSYVRLIEYQMKYADALLCCGTTAETQMLSDCEKKLLIKIAKATANNLPLIAGVEESSTVKAVERAAQCERLGANALLIAPPSFCKCTDSGYYRHVKAIATSVSVPVILYNIPSRCGYELNAEVIKKLRENEGIKYIKDAGSDLNYTKKLSGFMTVFCGNDGILNKSLNKNATGVISVVSNAAPIQTLSVLNGQKSAVFDELARLSMTEVNPVPIKYLLYKTGLFDTYDTRLPLSAACKKTRKKIDEFLKNADGEVK